MPDGVVRIGALAKGSSKKYAIDTAKDLSACVPVAITQKPPVIAHMTREGIEERKSQPEYSSLVSAWTEWQYAYSGSIVENGNRLRGALWCYRELCKHNDDLDCLDLADKVLELLNKRWGVYDVPSSRQDCDQMARDTAQSMAKVETRRWEDRA